MSVTRLEIGGHTYDLAVRDGQEAHFQALAGLVDARCRDAARGAGGLTEVRQLLFAALLLADEAQEARAAASEAQARHDQLEQAGEALLERHAALEAEAGALRDAAAAPVDASAAIAIERLAERIEALADGLEKATVTA